MNTNIDNFKTEINELKEQLEEFKYKLFREQTIHSISSNMNLYIWENDILYITLPYLLSEFPYQTKLFYDFLIRNKLDDFGVIVYGIESSSNEYYKVPFGILQYNIKKKYFNEILLWESLEELSQQQNIPDEYSVFYSLYLLSDNYNKPILNNNTVMNDNIENIKYLFRQLLLLTNKNEFIKSKYTYLNFDFNNYTTILKKINPASLINNFINDLDNGDINEPIKIYLCHENKMLTRVNINFIKQNSSYEPIFFLNLETSATDLLSDILNKISFKKLTDELLNIDQNYKNVNYYTLFKDVITYNIKDILTLTSSYLTFYHQYNDNLVDFDNYLTDQLKLSLLPTAFNKDMKYIFWNSVMPKLPDTYLVYIIELAKKILIDCMDLIIKYDIPYSPELTTLFI